MNDRIDAEYYEVIRRGSFAEKLLVKARERMFRDFMKLSRPTSSSSVLDVGVSDVQVVGANWLESAYPYPNRIRACGLGEGEDFRRAFPAVVYTKITPNARLPFEDNEFDIATANAVLEHVGSAENQRRFISELTRIARKIFVTVPNRFFPVEHHTGIPLLHYTDATFALACKLTGKKRWLSPESLILMSKENMDSLCPRDGLVGCTGIYLGPFSSNLFVFSQRP